MRKKYYKLYLFKMLTALLLTVGIVSTTVAQDTISYCGDEPFETGIGTSGSPIWWGIRIPASLLAGHESISEVLVYINNGSSGNYILTLFQGGTDIPQTNIYSRSYSFTTNLNAYKSCSLSYPVPIDDTKNLWVIFQTNDIGYPASACAYTGNPNSNLVSTNGYSTLVNLSDISQLSNSWMIKVIANTGSNIPVAFNCSGNGHVQKTYAYDGDRCGNTDYYSDGFFASYDFLPDEDSELSHLYVNNVDRINDVYTHYSGSSGVVHTFGFTVSTANSVSSSISINPVFSPRSGHDVAVDFNCTGDGQVQNTYTYNGNRCGNTDYYSEGFYASYDFLPDEGNELTHLYVNNVDRINDVYTYYSGSSAAIHTFGFVVSSANSVSSSISINPVFSPRSYLITVSSADTAMGYVVGSGEYVAGSTATIKAIPYTGFIFHHWNDYNTENPRSVVVQGNEEYVAYFVKSDGIDIIDSKLNLTLYPNPTSDYTTVSLSGVSGTVSLSVVDINGKFITSKYITCDGNCETYLDIKDFDSGTYFVYATTLDGSFTTRKLLVK